MKIISLLHNMFWNFVVWSLWWHEIAVMLLCGLFPNSRNFKLNFRFHCKKKISSFFFWYIYVRFFNVYYNISFISFLVPPSKAIIMDERGMEVRGSKVGPVLEGSTLILTCDIIGGKEKIKSSFFISHTYIHFFSSSFLANLWQMYIYLFLLFPLSDLIWKYIRVSNFSNFFSRINVLTSFNQLLIIFSNKEKFWPKKRLMLRIFLRYNFLAKWTFYEFF